MNLMDKFLGKNKEDANEAPPQIPDRRIQGKIIKVHEDGYGFITSRDIEFTRIFFHWSSLVQNTLNFKQLREGMIVEFTPQDVPGKGWRALRIKVLNKE